MFGINAASEIFQKVLEKLLLPCAGAINFVDDILIYGENEEELQERVKFTLSLLRKVMFF